MVSSTSMLGDHINHSYLDHLAQVVLIIIVLFALQKHDLRRIVIQHQHICVFMICSGLQDPTEALSSARTLSIFPQTIQVKQEH